MNIQANLQVRIDGVWSPYCREPLGDVVLGHAVGSALHMVHDLECNQFAGHSQYQAFRCVLTDWDDLNWSHPPVYLVDPS